MVTPKWTTGPATAQLNSSRGGVASKAPSHPRGEGREQDQPGPTSTSTPRGTWPSLTRPPSTEKSRRWPPKWSPVTSRRFHTAVSTGAIRSRPPDASAWRPRNGLTIEDADAAPQYYRRELPP